MKVLYYPLSHEYINPVSCESYAETSVAEIVNSKHKLTITKLRFPCETNKYGFHLLELRPRWNSCAIFCTITSARSSSKKHNSKFECHVFMRVALHDYVFCIRIDCEKGYVLIHTNEKFNA